MIKTKSFPFSVHSNLHVGFSKQIDFSTTKHLTIQNQKFSWAPLKVESIKQLCINVTEKK